MTGDPVKPDPVHVEAVDRLANEWVDGWASEKIAEALLTSTVPAVLDAMQDALVRAGRLDLERQSFHTCNDSPHAYGCTWRHERRLVTEWQEVT